jgi:CBS domain-containing protein
VYDYVDGKADWLAAGLPTEGSNAERPTARDVARDDVPTCRLDEPVGVIRARVQDLGWDACVVVNAERVVFGLLRDRELSGNADDDRPVEEVMRPGPSTFRPNVPIEEMAAFMTQHDLASSPITSSDGRLIGLLRKEDAVRVGLEVAGHHHGNEP